MNRVGIANTGLLGDHHFGHGGPICFRCGVGLGVGIGRPWGYAGSGFGWEGGWGLGFGLGWYDPFWFAPWYDPWYDPYWGGLDFGYDTYSPDYYPDDNSGYQLYANPDAQYYPPNEAAPPANDGHGLAEPNVTPDVIPPNSTGVFYLYLQGGAVVTASDYWFDGNKLHYTIGDAGEITISTDQLDLQRTVQENAKRGLHFTMKTAPGNASAVPPPTPAQSSGSGSNAPVGTTGGALNHI